MAAHKTAVTLLFDDSEHAHDMVKALAEHRLVVHSEHNTNPADYRRVRAEVAMPYKGWTYGDSDG